MAFIRDDGLGWPAPLDWLPEATANIFGAVSHSGDPEFCRILLRLKSGESFEEAIFNTDMWEVVSQKSYAHVGSVAEAIETAAVVSGHSVFFRAEDDKHALHVVVDSAQYVNSYELPFYAYGGVCFYDYADRIQNIGSYAFANSWYINRFIFDV